MKVGTKAPEPLTTSCRMEVWLVFMRILLEVLGMPWNSKRGRINLGGKFTLMCLCSVSTIDIGGRCEHGVAELRDFVVRIVGHRHLSIGMKVEVVYLLG